jgi:hypothetical protein
MKKNKNDRNIEERVGKYSEQDLQEYHKELEEWIHNYLEDKSIPPPKPPDNLISYYETMRYIFFGPVNINQKDYQKQRTTYEKQT